MSNYCALKAYAQTRIASGGGVRFVPMQHFPQHNQVLAGLPAACYERLLPKREDGPLPQGSIVYGAGERQKFLYFLTDGIVCRLHRLANGASAEFGLTGSEGGIGIAAFLGGDWYYSVIPRRYPRNSRRSPYASGTTCCNSNCAAGYCLAWTVALK